MSKKRAITMDDIAALAQVSKPTVSRALGNSPLVNAKTREHVRAVARKHGYAVNRNAQKLRHNRSNTIAVSIDFQSHQKNHVSDPFIFELLAGVSEALGDLNQDHEVDVLRPLTVAEQDVAVEPDGHRIVRRG